MSFGVLCDLSGVSWGDSGAPKRWFRAIRELQGGGPGAVRRSVGCSFRVLCDFCGIFGGVLGVFGPPQGVFRAVRQFPGGLRLFGGGSSAVLGCWLLLMGQFRGVFVLPGDSALPDNPPKSHEDFRVLPAP